MKIVSTHWFTEMSRREIIGIVTSENDEGILSTHIGTGAGIDEYRDAKHIAEYGAKFTMEHAKEIIDRMKKDVT